jgi:hypothetical protein
VRSNSKDREFDKFRPAEDGKSKVAVEVENTEQLPVTTLGVKWDSLNVSFPSDNQDLFNYLYQGEQVLSVLITYENASKKQITAIEKS